MDSLEIIEGSKYIYVYILFCHDTRKETCLMLRTDTVRAGAVPTMDRGINYIVIQVLDSFFVTSIKNVNLKEKCKNNGTVKAIFCLSERHVNTFLSEPPHLPPVQPSRSLSLCLSVSHSPPFPPRRLITGQVRQRGRSRPQSQPTRRGSRTCFTVGPYKYIIHMQCCDCYNKTK